VCYYLIEYLVSNFGKDEEITYLLRHREIIVTPMTNAVGYHAGKREETLNTRLSRNKGKSVDINRDFPYNQRSPKNCMNSIAGRVVYRIFAENLIVSSITFHGGTNVVSYPWGSRNHLNKEAPDHVALHTVGEAMVTEAGDTFRVIGAN